MKTEKSGIDRLFLKTAACLLMLLDHIGYKFWFRGEIFHLFRIAGRAAFPIFAFMLAEGASKTRNGIKYLMRLIFFGLITEPFYDRCFFGSWSNSAGMNVMFTLAAGLLSILLFNMITEEAEKRTGAVSVLIRISAFVPVAFLCAAAEFLKTDYGMYGVGLMFLFGIIDRSSLSGKALTVAVTVAFAGRFLIVYEIKNVLNAVGLTAAPAAPSEWLINQIYAAAALILLLAYNGSRGPEIKSSIGKAVIKYGFYAFYPLHMFILWLIAG